MQDAASYQKLMELVECAEELDLTRQAVADMKAGHGRTAAEMLAEMQQILDKKRAR